MCSETPRQSDDQAVLGQVGTLPDVDKSRLTLKGCVRAEMWADQSQGRPRPGQGLGRQSSRDFWEDSSEKDITAATDCSLKTLTPGAAVTWKDNKGRAQLEGNKPKLVQCICVGPSYARMEALSYRKGPLKGSNIRNGRGRGQRMVGEEDKERAKCFKLLSVQRSKHSLGHQILEAGTGGNS